MNTFKNTKSTFVEWGRLLQWFLFFVLILSSWVVLYWLGDHSAHRYHLQHQADLSLYINVVLMWSLMVIAMMTPTLVPTLNTLKNILSNHNKTIQLIGFWWFLSGYIVLWLIASLGLAGLQLFLWQHNFWGMNENLFYVSLALFAGAYQFSSWKYRTLTVCQNPMMFFMSSWHNGKLGFFSMGLKQGSFCLGCCWALMALCLISGAMQIGWMGLLLLIMVVEKLGVFSRRFDQAIGLILLMFGLYWLTI